MSKGTSTKTCFIIMPISDNSGYPAGHFNRVYEYLIKPACSLAGFEPIRADEVVATNYIALDIVKKIISSDMAICDLSSQNPNVLYELGIRQAFDKPVTLIKDNITNRIFDIQGFRDMVYDESLRIDNVQNNIEQLSEAIKDTYENRTTEINSLIKLLGITAAEVNNKIEILPDTEILLEAINGINKKIENIENKSTPAKSNETGYMPMNDYSLKDFYKVDKLSDLKRGDIIYHERFGFGEVLFIEKLDTPDEKVTIKFSIAGVKKFLFKYMILYKRNA